jgi:hypothetical protein
MKYILLISGRKAEMEDIWTWPKEDFDAHIAFLVGFNKKLTESGEMVAVVALTGPDKATIVRAGQSRQVVTDGVFPESKEFLAGYWIVDVETAEQAYAIAERASAAPGRGGVPTNIPIEVRQIMSGPPIDLP